MTNMIELHDVRYQWRPQDRYVFTLPHLEIRRGEHIFLQGPSGSGKSTLLGLLTGILPIQQGRVVVLGQHLELMTGRQRDGFRADHFGYVFQMFNLLPYLSVVENVLLPVAFSSLKRDRLRKHKVEPEQEAERLLNGLALPWEIHASQKIYELSVGQQQRVAVARALMGGPEILICDEPTSALDEETKEVFVELLFAETQRHGSTVVFASHDRTLAKLFPRHLQISDVGSFIARETDK